MLQAHHDVAFRGADCPPGAPATFLGFVVLAAVLCAFPATVLGYTIELLVVAAINTACHHTWLHSIVACNMAVMDASGAPAAILGYTEQ